MHHLYYAVRCNHVYNGSYDCSLLVWTCNKKAMKIILFIIVGLFLFERATRSYLNPYKLIFLFGKKGSGKTTNLTKIALEHLKKGWKVYSTIEIPGTTLFDVQDIGKRTFPEKSCILIDEVGMIWDNRDFKQFKPEAIEI